MGKWRWIAGALLLALCLCLAVYLAHAWFRNTVIYHFYQAEFAVVGVAPGDTVPKKGRVITRTGFRRRGAAVVLPFPMPLYPGARVQGVNISEFRNSSGDAVVPHVIVLMSTSDPEARVLDYYMRSWQEFRPSHLKLRSSTIYPKGAPQGTPHFVTTQERQHVRADVDVQCGAAWKVVDGPLFQQYLAGKAEPQLAPGGRRATEIMLWVPRSGDAR